MRLEENSAGFKRELAQSGPYGAGSARGLRASRKGGTYRSLRSRSTADDRRSLMASRSPPIETAAELPLPDILRLRIVRRWHLGRWLAAGIILALLALIGRAFA